MSSVSRVNYQQFSFNNFVTLRNVDFVTSIVQFARAFEDIDPIKPGSIKILLPAGFDRVAAMTDVDLTPLFGALLQAKTKPFNAIAFVGALDDEKLAGIFEIQEAEDVCDEYQENAVRLMTAALVNLVSRGALPGASPQAAKLNLPKFVLQTVKLAGLKTEGDLRNALMDFDTKHVNMASFFTAENLQNFNAILANRFAIGVAGHKPLTVAQNLSGMMIDLERSTTKEAKLVQLLITKAQQGQGGMYKGLHPYVQTIGQKYKGFYPQCLRAIYHCLSGNHEKKIEAMQNHPALRPDELVKSGKIAKLGSSIAAWDLAELTTDLGEALMFTSRTEAAERVPMVKSFGTSAPSTDEKKKSDDLLLEEESETEEVASTGLMSIKQEGK